jgi:hypothetical protein
VLTDHQRRQLAGRLARKYPAAMLRSPYLRPDEIRAAERRVRNAQREAKDATLNRPAMYRRTLRPLGRSPEGTADE